MQKETISRINAYKSALPGMRDKIIATFALLLIGMILAGGATYAWVTLSRAPALNAVKTTFASNGSLEIALCKEDGSKPDEFDIDESQPNLYDVTVSNLQWGNIVNLYDNAYGIDNLALRPAELNDASLKTNPLKAATYGKDGRVNSLNSSYSFARYDKEQQAFVTSSNTYGVRAIASYTKTISTGTQAIFEQKIKAVDDAQTAVYTAYNDVPPAFSGLGTIISKYAQAKIDDPDSGFSTGGDPDPSLAPNLNDMIKVYTELSEVMEKQKEAIVALANLQSWVYANNSGGTFTELKWEDILASKADYNATSTTTPSINGVVSLVGLNSFIKDYDQVVADTSHLKDYYNNYLNNGTAYYWSHGGESNYNIANMVARLIEYEKMEIAYPAGSRTKVVNLASLGTDLLSVNNTTQEVYILDGILKRFEQYAIKDTYRLNGKASCNISIKAQKIITLTVTIKGKAYTEATGLATFAQNAAASTAGSELVANDSVAEDTFGMAVDVWLRTNAESTCITLEGATAADKDGNIVGYDGINRIWGATGTKLLTTESTTQGGGSSYVYYADTPEDAERSKKVLEAMKVAFVDENGTLLATASMDTAHIFALNGRFTVPLVLDTGLGIEYTTTDDLGAEVKGRAITAIFNDIPIRLQALIYLDGSHLNNTDVLSNAEIQGQLNIQFGSSENLQTLGDNNIKGDTRSVTATVSKTSMDYDTATTEDDLLTDITLHVSGANPSKITSFFMREISSTQGSREEEIEFTKNANDSWIASYKFKSPGTYWLRYVRLDGIDYPLSEPQKVEVAGFALKSLTWGEAADNALVQTSAESYKETVTVEFATSDYERMPKTVKAQFMEETTGNTNVFSLSYYSQNGKWIGTGTFSTSGTYKLRYLTYDDKYYKDLASLNMSKTLTLSLGMYAKIADRSGMLNEQYESGKTFSRNIGVKVFDNTNNEIQNLNNVRLYYSNGGSASNTINDELIWDHNEQSFLGTLKMTRAGKYSFSSLLITQANGTQSSITKVSESPTYRIFSPDPPAFDITSQATYNTDTQFAPLTYDAVIDNIKIANSESASLIAVVYNEESKEYYSLSIEDGNVIFAGSSWMLKLPSYTKDLDGDGNPLPDAKYTQEGKWDLIMLRVSDCYDAAGNERTEENPIIWLGSDSLASAYRNKYNISPDAEYSFGRLSTTVSCTVKVTMVPGETALGGSDAPFMSHFGVDSIGMYVLITDENGRIIPANKINDVTLNVSYHPPVSTAEYGYKVMASASREYEIELNDQDAEDGHRKVNGVIHDWQYVGPYDVTGLKVTIGSNVLSFTSADDIGVPQRYTVTTAAPSADNIDFSDENIKQRNLVIGKTGDAVTATFLQGGDPGVTAKVSLATDDNSDTRHVLLDDVAIQLILTYQGGSQANGGYTFTQGTSNLENITKNLTNNSGTFQSSATSLLAGTYTAKLKAVIGSAEITRDLQNIQVFSKSPSIKIAGVSKPGESFDMSTYTGEINDTGEPPMYLYNNMRPYLVSVQNYKSDTVANVYIEAGSYTPQGSDQLIGDYTLPKVTLSVTDLGSSFSSATATVGSGFGTFTFAPGSQSATAEIGKIINKSFQYSGGCDGTVTVNYEAFETAGTNIINSLAIKDANGTTYTVNTVNSVTIRQPNAAPPSISYAEENGFSIHYDAQISEDGAAMSVTLPTTIGTVTKDEKETDSDVDWVEQKRTVTKLEYATIKSSTGNPSSSTSCGTTTFKNTWTTVWTHHLYERTYVEMTKTSATRNVKNTYGLVGWEINGVIYAPGQTVEISSVVTATPKIGVIDSTIIGTASVETILRRTETDKKIKDEDETQKSGEKTSTNSANAAAALAQEEAEGKGPNLRTGYAWFNSSHNEYVEPTEYEDVIQS